MAVTRDYELASAVYPDPRTLYEKDEWYYESPYRNYQGAASGFAFGILMKLGHNWAVNRPMKAGIHMYGVYALSFGAIGYGVQQALLGYFSYRDRVARHYIATHPQDFPPPPKVKVGEKWEFWNPTR